MLTDHGRSPRSALLASARVLLFLTLLAPLVWDAPVLYGMNVGRAVVFRTLVTLALFAVLGRALITETERGQWRDPFLFGLVAFVLIAVIAALAGVAPLRSLYGELQRMGGAIMWLYLLLYYVLLRAVFDERDWRRFLIVVAVTGALISALAIAQRFSDAVWLPVDASERVTGTLGNPGFLGIYLLVQLGVLVLLFMREQSVRARVLLSVALLLLLTALGLSVTLSAFAGLLVFAAVNALALLRPWRSARGLVAALGLLVAGVALLWVLRAHPHSTLVRSNAVLTRLATLDATSRSLLERFEFWRATVPAVREHPLLGWGPGNFNVAFSQHRSVQACYYLTDYAFVDNPHNGYLDVLVGAGIVGLAAFAALWVSFFVLLRRGARAGRLTRRSAVVLAATCAGYLTYLLTWFDDLNSLPLLVALAAFAGSQVLGGPLVRFSDVRETRAARVLAFAVPGILCAVLLYVHGYRLVQSTYIAREALRATYGEERFALLAEAMRIAPPEAAEIMVPYVNSLQAYAPVVAQVRANPSQRSVIEAGIRDALAALERQQAVDPQNDFVYVQKSALLAFAAQFYESRTLHNAALRDANIALDLSPRNVERHATLADIYMVARDTARARATLVAGLELYEGCGVLHYYLSRLALDAGRLEESEASLRRAWQLDYWDTGWHTDRLAHGLWSAGRAASAAEVSELYLARAAPSLSSTSSSATPDGGLPAELIRLTARLPVLWLQAGQPVRAEHSARELARVLPRTAATVREFLAALRSGATDRWLRAEYLVSGV